MCVMERIRNVLQINEVESLCNQQAHGHWTLLTNMPNGEWDKYLDDKEQVD